MDITKNGVPQYGYSNQKYTKTGQLISNELPIILDKNSPIIQFESAYVKDKIVKLFGGKVIPNEITEQEASLINNELFNQKCQRLFSEYSEKISINELKYFTQVTTLPARMFRKCKIKSIEFPEKLQHIGDFAFVSVIFDHLDFIIPSSVTSIGLSTFSRTNLRSLSGDNVIYTYGHIAELMSNLENLNLPKLKEVKVNKNYPNGLPIFSRLPKLKSINLPELRTINPKYNVLFRVCPSLEEVVCPKLQDLCIFKSEEEKNLNKIILSDKINYIGYYYRSKLNEKDPTPLITIPNTIQFGFDTYVNTSKIYLTNWLSRYNNIDRCLPIPIEDLSNIEFSNYFYGMNNIPNNYSKVKLSTETFKSSPYAENTINTNLGFSEIHIVKSASKKINKFILGNSACLQKLFLETDIKEIDDLAFKYCSSLKEVHFNQELEKIGSFAFALLASQYPALSELPEGRVHYLQSFNIPKNVNNIGDNPLLGQEQLTKTTLTLDPENKNFILE